MKERFFIKTSLTENTRALRVDNPDLAHQMKRVLRLKAGDLIVVLDNSGYEFPGVIVAYDKDGVTIDIGTKYRNEREPSLHIVLYQGMVKKDSMAWIVQKCTEVGVMEIVPVISRHCVKQGVNLVRMRAITQEAAEQSQRGKIPVIRESVDFQGAFSKASEAGGAIIFLHTSGSEKNLQDVLRSLENKTGRIAVFIGPEGGWSEEEVLCATQAGARTASLGRRILRSETAAVVASYVCANNIYDK